jgi:hypothetical protein
MEPAKGFVPRYTTGPTGPTLNSGVTAPGQRRRLPDQKCHLESTPSRALALTSSIPRYRAKKVFVGYGSRGGDAKIHASRKQTGQQVGGLDGERP